MLTKSDLQTHQCLTGKCDLRRPVNLPDGKSLKNADFVGYGAPGMMEMHSEIYTGICMGELYDDNQNALTATMLEISELVKKDEEIQRDEPKRMLRGV